MDASTYETLRNQTLLFFIERLLEKSPRSLHDLSCQFGSKSFSKEMRQIAGGSQAGLRKFLLQYPALFSLDGDLVAYATTVKARVGRDYNQEAVEYFRTRLLQYGFNVRVPIRSLLGHRSQANTEVRHVSGQHYNEFRDFLERNSEFVLSEEFVWLKEFEHETVTEFKELLSSNYDKETVYRLCKFFVGLIVEKGPMLVEQLFHGVGVEFEAGEFEGIFKNPNDLGAFLRIQPQCFQVHSNLVTLSETYSMGLDFLQKQCENTPKFHSIQSNDPPPPQQPTLQRQPSFTSKPSVQPPPRPAPTPLMQITIPPPQQPSNNNQNASSKATNNNANPSKTLKQRVSTILIQTLSQNNEKDYKGSARERENMQATQEDRVRTAILSKTTIVSNPRRAKPIVEQLLKQKWVGLDCEGVNLGQDGRVTMVQVATQDGAVYIFDVIPDGIMNEVRVLLEADVLKVMHDCRNDSVNLFNQFNVKLNNIFDTQSAHIVIQTESGHKVKNISLNNLCELYNIEINQYKDKVKSVYRHDPKFWLRRPLTVQMQSYAASDVITLIKLYPLLKDAVAESDLFVELCFEQVNAHITPEEIKARRRLRKNEGDIKELQKKLDACTDLTRLVLSNREVRLIKHMALSESTLEQLSNSLKVAKKLQKNQLSDSSSESNLTSLETSTMDSLSSLEVATTATEKITSIERLIDQIIVNPIVPTYSNASTQTLSTGDIILSRVWDGN